MSHEKAIAAALGPILDDLLALEKRVEQIQLKPGPKGEAGQDADAAAVAALLSEDEDFSERVKGEDGENGSDGAGIDSPPYVAGAIYREGALVVAHIGQHFVAVKDTAAAPGDSEDWKRLGNGGFRHRGAFEKDAAYRDGDLYVNNFGTYCVVHGEAILLAGRGAIGKTGDPGPRGGPGRDGRAGATIVGAQVQGFKLVLVQQDADGAIDHIEADFTPAFQALVRETVAAMLMERAA